MKKYLFLTLLLLIPLIAFSQKAELPDCIEEFLFEDLEFPFGKIGENAPKELVQFGKLAGVWEMTAHAERNGQWYSGWPCIWAWKYALDGSIVLDYFYRSKENTPTGAPTKMDIHAYNLRVYDPETNSWSITWAANNSKEYRYQAAIKGEEIWMTPSGEDDPKMRIIFSDISQKSFKWRVENLDSLGNWTYNQYMMGKRIL